jgi:hypothetical protein
VKSISKTRFTVAHRDGAKLGGQGEDDMKVVHRQEPLETTLDPACLRERLALRAMPIAARVVRGLLVTAGNAHVEVSAERGGPALLDRSQSRALLGTQHVALPECLAVRARGCIGDQPSVSSGLVIDCTRAVVTCRYADVGAVCGSRAACQIAKLPRSGLRSVRPAWASTRR